MTRDEWIKKARVLLADNPGARALLAATPEASLVIEAEIVEDDERENREEVVKISIPDEPADRLVAGAHRASRFLRFVKDEGESPLRGTARLNQKIGQAYERGVDTALDKMENVSKLVKPLDRAGVFGRRRK